MISYPDRIFTVLGLQIIFAAALPTTAAAEAQAWQTIKPRSITFVAVQAGAPFEGRFEQFEALIQFSPDALEESRFQVGIDLASVETDYEDRDEILRGAEFFDVKAERLAVYEAVSFADLGGNKFRADGQLSLNGRRLPVVLAFTFVPAEEQRNQYILRGHAEFNRLDFGIGLGDWADEKWISHTVEVHFSLQLTRID
ncbi:MAG: YceI family protein [Gammaproteobacteria bacterium]|nr:YceI family protein [Gammaproteobacteria bacterium]